MTAAALSCADLRTLMPLVACAALAALAAVAIAICLVHRTAAKARAKHDGALLDVMQGPLDDVAAHRDCSLGACGARR